MIFADTSWQSSGLVCMAVLITSATATSSAEESFPYPAVVTSQTDVRCGPGAHYYPTDRLTAGQRLEVYQQEGGWLAVRPPQGSFSWVPASQLTTTKTDGVMVAKSDAVRVWIGTALEQLNKHHFQVELRAGEAVEVIGEKQLVAPSGAVADTWYKISPPAGEFRWIPRSMTRRDDGGLHGVATNNTGQRANSSEAVDAAKWETSEINAQVTEPSELQRVSDVEPAPLPRPRPQNDKPVTVTPAPKPEWLIWEPPTDPIEFDRVLESLDTAVSRIVSQPAEKWDLTEQRIKAGKLADGGPSALHRGKARKLLSSIAEFEAVANRLTQPADAIESEPSDAPFASPSTNAKAFAGQGWLMPVHSTNESVPKYAVVDDNGRFLQFVTPAPGLNLRRYEKKRVGLVGPSSYIPALDMPHITAQRVVTLR